MQVGIDSVPKNYDCFSNQNVINSKNGFINSPNYPSYSTGVKNCEITISANQNGLIVYLIDLSMNDYNNDSNK